MQEQAFSHLQEEGVFTHYVAAVQQRTQVLYQNAQALPDKQMQLVLESLQELSSALEELRVAEEELRLQNEALVTTHHSLLKEQQRYRDLFEFAPDAYLVTDVQGLIQEANQASVSMFKLKAQYIVGKPLVNFVPIEQRPSFRAVLGQLPTINRVQEWELTLYSRSKEPFQAALTVETMRSSKGDVVGLRWLVRDITARKQSESQLHEVQLQNLKLVETERLKDLFLAMVSHELRTPLSSILGFAHLLLRQSANQQNPQMLNMVERIYSNGQHLLKMVEEMLDFSKLKTNRLDLRAEAFDLVELVTTTLEELRPLAQQKALTLDLKTYPSAFPIINDQTRLRQVITNLVSNAIKFTEAGGITVEIWELPEGRMVLLVSDTGIGIDPKDQDYIFQEFWQVSQGLTRQNGGIGLGLAIVHALVHTMDGAILVDSQLGRGTTFRVELPRRILPASLGSTE